MRIKRIEDEEKVEKILEITKANNDLELNRKEILNKCKKVEDYPLHYRVVLPEQALFVRKIDYKVQPKIGA